MRRVGRDIPACLQWPSKIDGMRLLGHSVMCEQLPDVWNNGDEAYSLSQEHERLVYSLLRL